RKAKPLEAKALETLGLDTKATGKDIKARYKELVKRHHPDANGGDRGSEDRFRDVLQAYRVLKQAGLCWAHGLLKTPPEQKQGLPAQGRAAREDGMNKVDRDITNLPDTTMPVKETFGFD